MVLLSSDSSSAVANSAALVSVDESRYTIILAAKGKRRTAVSLEAKPVLTQQQALKETYQPVDVV